MQNDNRENDKVVSDKRNNKIEEAERGVAEWSYGGRKRGGLKTRSTSRYATR